MKADDHDAVKAEGAKVLPRLVRLYETSDVPTKAKVAQMLYRLSWKSPEAKTALLRDVHTDDSALRLQVQWALGRVSDDPEVVDVLLENMRKDANALFRDKAGCALAYDQVHLSRAQRYRLFAGVIAALDDESADVRRIAIQVLQIHTQTTRGFAPNAPPAQRKMALEAWQAWLAEYRASL